jgi:hypothetical protein|tara:strand:- start:198 stop:608 length:411 start_codon:yes stop_codon:yes gene_type:complete
MSELNSINGGYVGGSPKVRSTNPIKPLVDVKVKLINVQELIDNITKWHDTGRITSEGIQEIASQLQHQSNIKRTEYDETLLSLKTKKETLDKEIKTRKSNLSAMEKNKDLADMVESLETFFGKDKIASIRNLIKNQ